MMTKGIMSKPYPRMEMRWAVRYKLPIVGVMDKSTAGGADFIYDELAAAPEDLKFLCKDVEYIPYRTKAYEQGPMIDEIMQRAKLMARTSSAAPPLEATRGPRSLDELVRETGLERDVILQMQVKDKKKFEQLLADEKVGVAGESRIQIDIANVQAEQQRVLAEEKRSQDEQKRRLQQEKVEQRKVQYSKDAPIRKIRRQHWSAVLAIAASLAAVIAMMYGAFYRADKMPYDLLASPYEQADAYLLNQKANGALPWPVSWSSGLFVTNVTGLERHRSLQIRNDTVNCTTTFDAMMRGQVHAQLLLLVILELAMVPLVVVGVVLHKPSFFDGDDIAFITGLVLGGPIVIGLFWVLFEAWMLAATSGAHWWIFLIGAPVPCLAGLGLLVSRRTQAGEDEDEDEHRLGWCCILCAAPLCCYLAWLLHHSWTPSAWFSAIPAVFCLWLGWILVGTVFILPEFGMATLLAMNDTLTGFPWFVRAVAGLAAAPLVSFAGCLVIFIAFYPVYMGVYGWYLDGFFLHGVDEADSSKALCSAGVVSDAWMIATARVGLELLFAAEVGMFATLHASYYTEKNEEIPAAMLESLNPGGSSIYDAYQYGK